MFKLVINKYTFNKYAIADSKSVSPSKNTPKVVNNLQMFKIEL